MCAWKAPVGSQKQHLNRVTKLFNHQAEKSKPKRGGKNDVRTSYLVSSLFILLVLSLKFSFSPYRKRAESESRKSSLPNSKEVPSHHPTDPVELRRLNFQTPGKWLTLSVTDGHSPVGIVLRNDISPVLIHFVHPDLLF